MKFILPDLIEKSENSNALVDTFWENFYYSHTKTAMLLISVILVVAYAITEILARPSDGLQTAFYMIMSFWAGGILLNKPKIKL
ncbi:hypothetical protein KJ934_00335 [Patescibacteria group bacterium]|nr:hypothetical protein [Patescibacteria group bacterium]MBU4353380.1 hypothetical protein [Patescibacteria group bacterium]MBU4477464.1 hypothetical protein [Patescibacteria group bacterium]MCG2699126.1 hypothetical protein [Candidatus Parcubacteria bacterium]